MFNFTTTTLIHSLDLFAANPTNTTTQNAYSDPSVVVGSSQNTFWVNGVNLFRKENVVAIYRSPYRDPLAGRLVVDVDGIWAKLPAAAKQGGQAQIRLKFFLRRSGDNNSYYATEEIVKGKDFIYEWIQKSDTTAAKVAKLIKKINRLYGDIYFDVHEGKAAIDDKVLKDYDKVDGSAFGTSDNIAEVTEDGKLVFVNDNYGMFTDATLEAWVEGEVDCCHYEAGKWVPVDWICDHSHIEVCNCSVTECESLYRTTKDSEESLLHIVDCVNGNGTYQQILRDLRLPTMENLAYGSLTQQMNEMPIPGNKYVQYTLHYVTCRGILGGSAVGEVTHSKTTHVFFVPADCCECANGLDTAFQNALEEAFGWTVCSEGRLVIAPHDDPTLEPNMYNHLAPAGVGDTRTSNDTLPAEEEEGTVPTSEVGGGGGDVPNLYDVRLDEAEEAEPAEPGGNG